MTKLIEVQLQEDMVSIPQGTSLFELQQKGEIAQDVVVARVNNIMQDLHYQVTESCQIELIDLTSDEGMRVYRDSLVFILVRAAKEVIPNCRVRIEHSLSNGLFGEIEYEHPLVEADITKIELKMQEIIAKNEPFIRHRMRVEQASKIFSQRGLRDKVRLFKNSKHSMIDIHSCGEHYDTISDLFVPTTGYLNVFKLRFYLPGFILEFPQKQNPNVIPEYIEHGKLANVYYETEKWGKHVGISDAAALNEWISQGRVGDLVRLAEAYHEKQIARIADQIAAEKDRLRIILIAGPSSSGKTTFAQRLSIQLRINRLNPVSISLDDYFVDRELTPLDEDGNYDFEAIECIDVKLFNEHLSKIIQGEAVELPTFNFIEGQREWRGNILQVDLEQPIIIEGIHGLNDALTSAIPKARKFKIYVSALTQLNIDDHTRIPTTDVRKIRRIIRDNQFRSQTAIDTIYRWPSVRRGEEKHIFPFQEDADVMFNSALDYELAVLKRHVKPLLEEISIEEPAYAEAQRLLNLLRNVQEFECEDAIPCNSILREFIGDSCF